MGVNALYNKHREAAASGAFSWTASGRTFRFLVVSNIYTFDATHQYLSSIQVGADIAQSAPLVIQNATDGYLRLDNTLIEGIEEGDSLHALVLFEDSGVRATSKLMAYISDAIGLPFVATTSDFYVIMPTATQAVYRL